MAGVKHVEKFHDMKVRALRDLTAKHLLAILQSSRGRITCSCGIHCGDDDISKTSRDWNLKQQVLNERVQKALSFKEHVEVKPKKVAKKQKKVLKY